MTVLSMLKREKNPWKLQNVFIFITVGIRFILFIYYNFQAPGLDSTNQ